MLEKKLTDNFYEYLISWVKLRIFICIKMIFENSLAWDKNLPFHIKMLGLFWYDNLHL